MSLCNCGPGSTEAGTFSTRQRWPSHPRGEDLTEVTDLQALWYFRGLVPCSSRGPGLAEPGLEQTSHCCGQGLSWSSSLPQTQLPGKPHVKVESPRSASSQGERRLGQHPPERPSRAPPQTGVFFHSPASHSKCPSGQAVRTLPPPTTSLSSATLPCPSTSAPGPLHWLFPCLKGLFPPPSAGAEWVPITGLLDAGQ